MREVFRVLELDPRKKPVNYLDTYLDADGLEAVLRKVLVDGCPIGVSDTLTPI